MASRINFKIKKVGADAKVSTNGGFDEVFQKVMTDDDNEFYKLKADTLKTAPQLTLYSGKFINMPIPTGLETLTGEKITAPDASNIIHLLIAIEPKPTPSSKVEKHFCHEIVPEERGTACTGLLQQPLETKQSQGVKKKADGHNVTYFKTKEAIPDISGNLFFKLYVDAFNAYNRFMKAEYIYLLPTIAPNKTVIYIVSNDKNAIDNLINDCPASKNEDYFIGLNGFPIYIDDWDCIVFFENFLFDTVDIDQNKMTIKSKATVHKKKS